MKRVDKHEQQQSMEVISDSEERGATGNSMDVDVDVIRLRKDTAVMSELGNDIILTPESPGE